MLRPMQANQQIAGGRDAPKLNSVVPGKSPQYIAKAAGFDIPEDVTILAAECKEVGENEPLTMALMRRLSVSRMKSCMLA